MRGPKELKRHYQQDESFCSCGSELEYAEHCIICEQSGVILRDQERDEWDEVDLRLKMERNDEN